MTTQSENLTEELVKKVVIATAASVACAFIGTILFPGIGTVIGAKLGALSGSAS